MYIVRCTLSLLFICVMLDARERITSFVSDITVKPNATFTVQEQIEVISEGKEILHGIIREFPTHYRTDWGGNYNVNFNVISVIHNGSSTPFWVERGWNGKKVYIGDKDILLPRGKHSYVITYQTNRQIGFFNDHDEIYWNVTGNGWRLPIGRVEAHVYLPENITQKSIGAEAYTGYQSNQGDNYSYLIEGNHVFFSTKQKLEPYEGLTIVVTFPKGFIAEPTLIQKILWFLQDNIFFIVLGIALLLLAILCIAGKIIARRRNKPGNIIPLFYPPEGMTPSEIGFINNMKFDDRFFAADIVYLAVRGFITINYDEQKRTYTLMLKDTIMSLKTQKNMNSYDGALLFALFGKKEQLVLTKKYNADIRDALQTCKKHTTSQVSSYVTALKEIVYSIEIIGFLMIFITYWWWNNFVMSWVILLIVSFTAFITYLKKDFILSPLVKNFFLIYTPEGRTVQDAIDGFTLYLTIAEIERMRIIGTPPTKTPELYEHYLPYAMALGVEKQWTEQFAVLFKSLEMQGYAYTPSWHYGPSFRIDSFSSELTSTFTNTIVAASTPPSSSSGSGGKGSSGGGGGGGGGGGW